jgi:hypothetical protein
MELLKQSKTEKHLQLTSGFSHWVFRAAKTGADDRQDTAVANESGRLVQTRRLC